MLNNYPEIPWRAANVAGVAEKENRTPWMNGSTRHFACNTYSYTVTHDAGRCLTALAGLGFSEIELMMYPGHLWPPDADAASRRQLRRSIEALGLRLISLNMPNIDMNIAGASAQVRRYTLDLLQGIIGLAGDLGVPGIVIGPGKANPLMAAPKQRLLGYLFEALDELAPLAAKAGTALWVENIPFAMLPTLDEIVTSLDRYGRDDIGIVYDVANGHFIGEDLAAALRRCGDRLRLVHLSDTSRQLYRHDPIGHGTVPFETIPAMLSAVGHTGRPVLEIISADADRDIVDGAERLVAIGFDVHGH
jgi:sugar phosphate isomerase/epimerase